MQSSPVWNFQSEISDFPLQRGTNTNDTKKMMETVEEKVRRSYELHKQSHNGNGAIKHVNVKKKAAKKGKGLKLYTRIVVAVVSLAMIPSMFVSVWQIQLEAPQYPEGLKMEIWCDHIAGDIDKINNLNHYIGMAKILEENFPEFVVMKYLIIAMVVFGLAAAIVNRRWMLWITSAYLVGCGVWGIIDFWKWEYQYGHNLNPHAAINIPGMTYQPPLFGWKQLLNFTAGSFPDIGGWLIIAPAAIIVAFSFYEQFRKK